jgi:hypothetical protein
MRRKHFVTALAVVALGAPMTMFTASATADNDGIPECGGKFHLLEQTAGSGRDRNGNGLICISNEPGGNDLFHLHDDH